jgi:4-amino-4-deoxy-L-arabinose transferase-like glycosyltransferase
MGQQQHEELNQGYGKAVLAVLASAFLLRLISLFIVEPSLASDPQIYHTLARSLIEKGSFSFGGAVTAYRPPLYPFFLAALYALPGSDILTVRLVQAMIDVLICLLVFRLGRRLYSPKEGITAAILIAVYPPYILYSQSLFSETLFTLILLTVLDFLVSRPMGKGGRLTTGVLLGLGALLKPVMMIFPAVLIVWERLQGHLSGRVLKQVLLVTLFLAVTVSPWIVRNRSSLGEWVFTTNGGINFWIGNNPAATGAYSVPEDSQVFKEEDEVSRNRLAFDEAIRFWKDHPVEALKVLPWKFFFLFSSESAVLLNFFEGPQQHGAKRFAARYLSVPVSHLLVVNLPYYLLLLLSLPSLFLERGRDGDHTRFLLVLTILYWITVHLVFFGSNRFHMPIMAILAVFSARTLISADKLVKGTTGVRTALFFVFFLIFVTLWIGEWVGLLLSV